MNTKKSIDIFNGDADGLCALLQWRLVYPQLAQRISGVKRDNALLCQVASGENVDLLVLDINFENNRIDVLRLLAEGAHIRYFDHHYPGELIEHPSLQLDIDESPQLCTSLLVDRALAGQQRHWAIAGAFGDNLPGGAQALAHASGLSPVQTAQLQRLGELLNYNGYGSTLADLHFDPCALYEMLYDCGDPYTFMAEAPAFAQLTAGYAADMAAAAAVLPQAQSERGLVYLLPDQPWARRVIGVWANALSQQDKQRAHLIFCPDGQGGYTASVRAAQAHPHGAADFCRLFPGGGGRAAAGGITKLALGSLDAVSARFLAEFPIH